MFAQFVNVLYSIVDRIYIGNIPGDRRGIPLQAPEYVLRSLRFCLRLLL